MSKRRQIKVGGDNISSVISKIPIEFHMRTKSGKKYSFCGLNRDLSEWSISDETPKDWSKPINTVDEICMHHDINYSHADKDQGTRHEADKVMPNELTKFNNKDLSWNEYFAKKFT